jgi:hypothetical protein
VSAAAAAPPQTTTPPHSTCARALCQLDLFLSSRVVEETKTLSYIFHKVPMRAPPTHYRQ